MKSIISAIAFALITGCAGMNDMDCRADWYQVGQRDALLGASPQQQLDVYASRCGGAQPDAVRYMEGYRAGFAARPAPNW